MKISKGFRQLVREAEAGITTLKTEEFARRLQEPSALLIDLRDVRELKRDGKIPGAFHVPRGMMEFWIDPDSPYYRKEFDGVDSLLLYCNRGWRSALAARSLKEMGIDDVAHLDGGLEQWQADGGEIESTGG